MPPLADRFSTRPESGPDVSVALEYSTVVALVPRRAGAGSADAWRHCCGKSQLAAYFAESQWRARSIDLLMWIDASSKASILSGFVDAARAITGSGLPGNAESVTATLLSWLRRTDRRWLIVFDDLVDGEMLAGLWPAGSGGRVLVTAPSANAVTKLPGVAVAEVGPFSAREAMSYLVGRLSSDPDQRRGAMDLIEDLSCQPLALCQATAAIASSWLTCVDYRERFVRRSALISQHDRGPLPSARVTWTLSLDSADYLRPGGAAQSCLVLAALLDGHGVPITFFTSPAASSYIAGNGFEPGYAAQRSSNALQTLEQAGLVSLDRASDPPTVWMNQVMQHAVLAATPEDMFEQATGAAVAALLELWSDDRVRARYGSALRVSAENVRRVTGGLLWTKGCHPLLLRAGQSLDEDGLTGPAVDYWRELASVSDRALGPDHPDSLVLIERVANAYMAAGRSADAIAWYRRILSGWATTFGPEHPRTLAARASLGRVLITAGLTDEAIRVLSETLVVCERAFGPDNRQTQSTREELAAAYRAAGQMAAAIRIYRRTLGQREREAGPQDAGTIVTRQNLAEAYLADGKAKDAITHYKRALADYERSLGSDHPDTLRARASLASVYRQTGRMAVAVQLYEQVRTASERALGPDHPDTLATEVSLAGTYFSVGRISDATAAYRDAMERSERVLPPGDPLIQSARDGLASITGELGR
jgi:tetratricopeptide (TPR) repeat protein